MHQYLNYRGPREEEKKKWCEKCFEEITVKKFPNIGNSGIG